MKLFKAIIKPVMFLVILLGLLGALSPFFQKDGESVSNFQKSRAVLSQTRNSVDIFVLGDSATYTSFIPMELWENYGYTSYVSGFPARNFDDTIEILEQVLEKQHPAYVVLETNILFRDKKSLYYEAKNIFERVAYPFTPIIKRHDAWKQICMSGLQPVFDWKDPLKGYYINSKITPYEGKQHEKTDKVVNVSEKNTIYAERIKALCDSYNTELVLYSAPSMKNWTYARYHGLENLANKLDCSFIDLNVNDQVQIDWKHDSSDGGDHMNFYGARKITGYLGNYFSGLHTLVDKRDNHDYQEWNEDLSFYHKKKPTE